MMRGGSLLLTFGLLVGGFFAPAGANAQSPAAASVGRLEVHADTSMPARTISFGQIFLPGAVQRGDHLEVLLDGHGVPTQVDPKAFNSDGSVRHAILTIELPKLRSGQDLNAVIVKQGDAAPDAPPAAAAIPALDVIVGIKGADGAVKSMDVNLQAVAQNPKNAAPGFWLNGPLACWPH